MANTEPDEAGKLMMALSVTQAAKDLSGAVAFLQGNDAVTSDGVGVIGFCMGGGLALVLACEEPESVVACAPFYGLIPWPDAHPDWSAISATGRSSLVRAMVDAGATRLGCSASRAILESL